MDVEVRARELLKPRSTTESGISHIMIPSAFYGPVSMLPDSRPPWKEFGLSLGSQGLLVIAFLSIGILHPNMLTPVPRDYHAIQLVNTPEPVNQEPAPVRPIKAPTIAELKTPSEALKLPQVRPRVPVDDPLTVPRVEIAEKLPVQPTVTVIPKPGIKTNLFSSGSSQPPTINKSPVEVQTGGFGDPRGLATANDRNRPVTIARQGAFDLPSGAGYGNGSGGQHGARGVVASSGFGDGTAISDNSGRVTPASKVVRDSGFGDAGSVDPNQNAAKHTQATPRIKPAEILSKPTPAYTDEARKLHIEGEVLLEVVFEGSGSIRVVRVVHGLGHGLDESAIKAAQQIRFTPAQRDGSPVDFTGVLHIVFQLA
jgi:TonB family protein